MLLTSSVTAYAYSQHYDGVPPVDVPGSSAAALAAMSIRVASHGVRRRR
jgi:N-acetyl-beta-hexosaminidase